MSKHPIVLYRGPSMLDGAPILAIATLGSSNEKTGPMVQTWIIRADMGPMAASAAAADSSVCGECPRRHSLGGDCYVTLFQAPRSVHDHWVRAGSPDVNWREPKTLAKLAKHARKHGLRLGSYGDPAAVPYTVWRDLMAELQPKLHTGYTHQWRGLTARATLANQADTRSHVAWLRDNVMASADTFKDASDARALGWRYFLAVAPDQVENVPERTVLCLAEKATNPKTCETCGICNGAQGKSTRASVYLVEHGPRSQGKHKRSAALAVLR